MRRVVLVLALATSGCKDDAGLREALLDPQTCKDCHPTHYEQWRGSMHAYATTDPVFRAMNERGQRETNGELGEFCVKCHAPLAVQLGETEDGLNLDQVPDHLQGVTCYFCHNVVDVDGTHNNPLVLAMDNTMRGPIDDPAGNGGMHGAERSAFHDELAAESAELCGACHDIVTPTDVHLERTFLEWREGIFGQIDPATGGLGQQSQSCGACHMGPPVQGPIADFEGVPGDRRLHPHEFAGVDVAITQFPGQQAQRDAIAGFRRTALCSSICVTPADQGGFDVKVWLHNESAGHAWPSGATQDRRAWLELIAYAGDQPIRELGIVADDEPVDPIGQDPDPELWLLRDWIYDENGDEAHMFWEAAPSDAYPEGRDGQVLPVAAFATDRKGWVPRVFHIDDDGLDRVTTRLRLRPMPLDLIDDLVASGDLDAKFRDRIETFDVAPTVLEWTPDAERFAADPAKGLPEYGTCIGGSITCTAPCILGNNPENPDDFVTFEQCL